MDRKKVVILQKRIKEYRAPLFDGIGKIYDLTVVGYLDPMEKGDHYSVLKLGRKYLPVSFDFLLDKKLRGLLKDADAVIIPTEFRGINFKLLRKAAPKAGIITYGIGVSASYDEHYDQTDQSKQYLKMIARSDAVIFYYDYPKNKYVKKGADPDKIFVANNTVLVPETEIDRKPEDILFIGELYRQKGIDLLIEKYAEAYAEDNDVPKLVIVGDGAERSVLEGIVADRGLTEKIVFTGKITDNDRLKEIFGKAIVTVSPKQAGLSVLKSMAFGVPFVTLENAITGGEIFNIENGVNGVILKNGSELKDLILNCRKNAGVYAGMGDRAREFYFKNRTMDKMVDAFDRAIGYARKHLL